MKRVLACLFALLLLTTPVYAASDFYGAFDIDGLERAVPHGTVLEGVTPQTAGDKFDEGFLNFLTRASQIAPEALGDGLRAILGIIAIAALCAAANSVVEGAPVQYVQLAGVLGIAALSITGLNSLMSAGRDAITQMDTFSKALLPSLAAAAAASGKPAAALLRQTGTVIAADLLITMYDRLLCPMLYLYAALVTLNAALPRDLIKRVAGLVKWAVTGLLAVTLTIFTAYITIGGAISGSADAVTVKAAKTALSGTIPVVGGIIADASETVLVGASVIKNSIGIFGLLAVLGIVLVPLVSLMARYAAMKLGAALAGTVGNESLSGYVDSLAGLYSMLLGMVSATAFLLIISITSAILTGSP